MEILIPNIRMFLVIEKLTSITSLNIPLNDEVFYSLSEIKSISDKFEPVTYDTYISICFEKNKQLIKFAFFELAFIEASGSLVATIFHGDGNLALKKLRNIHFGLTDLNNKSSGFLYYPNLPAITAAFSILGDYFDF